MAFTEDIALVQGTTFTDVFRFESEPIVRKAISAISAPNGAARIVATGHGIPNGWRCAVTNVKGMTEINAADPNKIRDNEYTQATVIDANTVELNAVNAAGFKPYVSGGFLQYNTPEPLVGLKARMAIKPSTESLLLRCTAAGTSSAAKPSKAGIDGSVTWEATTLPATKEWLASTVYSIGDVVDLTAFMFLTTENGRIVIDTVAHTITRTITAADLAAATWKKGIFDLELVSQDVEPVVTKLVEGKASIGKERTA